MPSSQVCCRRVFPRIDSKCVYFLASVQTELDLAQDSDESQIIQTRTEPDSSVSAYLDWINRLRRERIDPVGRFRLITLPVWTLPRSIRSHPTLKNHYFVFDEHAIHLNDDYGLSSLIAGGPEFGCENAVGEHARFNLILDGVCTSDGKTLYVADCANRRIRAVDTKTRTVSTAAGASMGPPLPFNYDGLAMDCGFDAPRKLTFFRSPTDQSQSVLYIATYRAIRRFDLKSGEVTTVDDPSSAFDPYCIECTTGGKLIFFCCLTNSIHAIDPLTVERELIAGSATPNRIGMYESRDGPSLTHAAFAGIENLRLDDSSQSIWIFEGLRIRRMAIPPHLIY